MLLSLTALFLRRTSRLPCVYVLKFPASFCKLLLSAIGSTTAPSLPIAPSPHHRPIPSPPASILHVNGLCTLFCVPVCMSLLLIPCSTCFRYVLLSGSITSANYCWGYAFIATSFCRILDPHVTQILKSPLNLRQLLLQFLWRLYTRTLRYQPPPFSFVSLDEISSLPSAWKFSQTSAQRCPLSPGPAPLLSSPVLLVATHIVPPVHPRFHVQFPCYFGWCVRNPLSRRHLLCDTKRWCCGPSS